jgi:hypothetical protein
MNPGCDTNLAAICGIYCGSCPAYLALRRDDQAELESLARVNGIPVQEVGCAGCLSGLLMPECRECRHGFRACAKSHSVTWCFECPEFPCQRLRDFRNIHERKGVSHHKNVIADLTRMQEMGVESWLEAKSRESSCQNCGQGLYWFERKCPSCGFHQPEL